MLSACSERNLHGRIGDAITYLKELPARSQVIVSAFHLVEHISFEDLQTLVKESLRVLKAGGLLIMETPNPENIVVSTRDFYLDPTHQKPIPPNLLAFLPSFHGFCRSKILRLQESAELVQKEYPGLDDVLSGASPDYAVVAQKKAGPTNLKRFDAVFNQEFGISLTTLAKKFDHRVDHTEALVGQAAQQASGAEHRATQAEQRATQAEHRATQAEHRATQAESSAQQAQTIAQQTVAGLEAVYASRSWRLTSPLRQAGRFARWFRCGAAAWLTFAPQSRPRRTLRLFLMHLKLYISLRPGLKAAVAKGLAPFPQLKQRLHKIGLEPIDATADPYENMMDGGHAFTRELETLSPYAQKIYRDIDSSMKQNQKEQR